MRIRYETGRAGSGSLVGNSARSFHEPTRRFDSETPPCGPASPWSELIRKEDWWAIWIGVGLIAVAAALFAGGTSIKWLAVAPQKWSHVSDIAAQLQASGLRFVALFVLWSVLFGLGLALLGIRFSAFIPAFAVIFLVSTAIYFLGLWDQAAHYNLEPPLVALGLGLVISNTVGAPRWLQPALRVEFYIKTGIVLLGASLPLTLIGWAGPVAIVQSGHRVPGDFWGDFLCRQALWLGPPSGRHAGDRRRGCAECRARSPSGARWARKKRTCRWPFRWSSSGPS